MSATTIIDAINLNTMRSAAFEYSAYDTLTAPERSALASVAERLKDKHILDIGVGGGRTVAALREISKDYIGIDYAQEMIDRCRARFPDARFETGDARAMPQFADATFDLIVFSCNGICMVDHTGRLEILKEVRRLLSPGGVFIFSTYNKNSPEHDRLFVFPDFLRTKNPAKFLVRATRFVAQTIYRVFNRWRYKRHEIKHADYSILNDQCHHYQTMLYYIGIENQLRQLVTAGFNPAIEIYDLSGKLAAMDNTNDSLLFVAGV